MAAAAVAEHRNPKRPPIFLAIKKKGGCWKASRLHMKNFFLSFRELLVGSKLFKKKKGSSLWKKI
jgi:hypothetical protein